MNGNLDLPLNDNKGVIIDLWKGWFFDCRNFDLSIWNYEI